MGDFLPTFRVQSDNAIAERQIALRVVEPTVPLAITSAQLPAAVIGRSYEASLIAVGGVPPYRWTLTSTAPLGVELDANGRIEGTISPDASPGDLTFEVQVEDLLLDRAVRDVTLRLVQPSDVVVLLPDLLPDGRIQQPYCDAGEVRLRADGAFPPFRFSSVDLPDGLVLGTEGVLCGVPRVAGSRVFTVDVRDDLGFTDRGTFLVRIDGSRALTFEGPPLPEAIVGRPYEATVRAAGGTEPYRYDLSTGELPGGLLLQMDGRIVGTATSATEALFAVRATDARGASGQAGFRLIVRSPGTPAEDGGCACQGAHALGAGPLAWLLLGALHLMRRRRT
ncbi:MAG: hypothetical protein HC923_07370 [Myxococcales bacterium]|nr:hypothetical protein [Myxococcales bacterium]